MSSSRPSFALTVGGPCSFALPRAVPQCFPKRSLMGFATVWSAAPYVYAMTPMCGSQPNAGM